MSDTDSRHRNDRRQAWLSAGAPILALVLVVILAAFAVFVNFAGQQDRAFTQSSQRLVESAVDGRLNALRDVTLDFVNWNDAYRAVSVRWDGDWVSNNYYSSVTDGLIVFDGDGAIRHTWLASNLLGASARLPREVVRHARAIPRLAELMRARAVSDTVAGAITSIDGRLVFLAVGPVTPQNSAERLRDAADGGPVHYVVTVQVLSEQEVAAIGETLSLHDLRFVSDDRHVHQEDAVQTQLTGPDGAPMGALMWRHDRPGSAAFLGQIGPVLLGIILIGVMTLMVTRALVEKQLELARSAEVQFAADRLRSELLIELSEELRSPLNAVIGYAELLQEESGDGPHGDRVRQDAGRILAAARRLQRIISQPLRALHVRQRAARAESADQDA